MENEKNGARYNTRGTYHLEGTSKTSEQAIHEFMNSNANLLLKVQEKIENRKYISNENPTIKKKFSSILEKVIILINSFQKYLSQRKKFKSNYNNFIPLKRKRS